MSRFSAILILMVPMALTAELSAGIGPLPQDKTPLSVEETERNPFGRRQTKAVAEAVPTESEELKIRGVIEKLPVGGMTRGYGVTKVLLGSFMVQEGGVMPDVIPYQTEKVKVLSVSGDKVELGFVDKDGSAEARKIVLTVNLKPAVRFKLGVKAEAEPNEGDASFDGVSRKNEPGSPR